MRDVVNLGHQGCHRPPDFCDPFVEGCRARRDRKSRGLLPRAELCTGFRCPAGPAPRQRPVASRLQSRIRWFRRMPSRHHPSRMLRFKPPLQRIFCPLVPDASIGRRGCVQPDVASGHHLARDMDVVIFQENQPAPQFAVFAEVNYLLDLTFAFIVRGMRFSREDELNRAVRIRRQLDDRIVIARTAEGRVYRSQNGGRNRW